MSRAAATSLDLTPESFTFANLYDPIAAQKRVQSCVVSIRFGTPLGEALAENDRLIAEKRNTPGVVLSLPVRERGSKHRGNLGNDTGSV
jgi:hypothetical protein